MPARPRVTTLAALACTLSTGLLAGCSATGSAAAASSVASSAASPVASSSTPASAAPSPAPARPATPTRSGSPVASTAALPYVERPWDAGLEFGYVWGARRQGGDVLLTFDSAGMLTGDRAKAWYDAHPAEERLDYKILNDKSFTETLRVPASATVYGSQVLGPHNGSQVARVTLAQLAARATGNDQTRLLVWFERSPGSTRVSYLAEQYLP